MASERQSRENSKLKKERAAKTVAGGKSAGLRKKDPDCPIRETQSENFVSGLSIQKGISWELRSKKKARSKEESGRLNAKKTGLRGTPARRVDLQPSLRAKSARP